MTDTRRIPSPSGFAQHLHPFAADPGRWEAECTRALRTGHVRDDTCAAECEPVLVYERTRWGWLAWTIPGDGSRPDLPSQIGVLTPSATPAQRLALRWLTRRPARRIGLAPGIPASLHLVTVVVAFFSLVPGLFAMAEGLPADVALPAIVLAPLLAEHLPATLDARAREHVRSVEGASACRYLQRLAAWHTFLVQAAAGSDRYELRRSAEIGQHLLWDAADLLQTDDTRSATCALITHERLILQLADQVAQILRRAPAQARPDHPD
ncbi:hypothetical protein ACWDCC_41245 [Streptomyces sp. NPDC001102]